MRKFGTALTAAILASVITLIWLGTAGYLLRDLSQFVDPTRVSREQIGVGLLILVVPPILVWLLASTSWRNRNVGKTLRRIEAGLKQEDAAFKDEVKGLREASETAAKQLKETAKAAQNQRGDMAKVAAPMADLAGQLHGVLGEMKGLGEVVGQSEIRLKAMAGQIAQLNDAAQPLLQLDSRLTEQSEGLLAAIDELTKRGEAASAQLQGQARLVGSNGHNGAGPEPALLHDDKQIEAKVLRRVDFLADAKAVAEQLNAKAVDLHGLLKMEVPVEVLAAIREGDKTALARRLPRLKDRSGIRGLILLYGHDQAFRGVADHYMEQFEELLDDCREADPTNGLGALFITSDLGRLYLVLARETGRNGQAAEF